MSGIMIDPEKLIEFFDRHQEESCGYRYDISTTDELRQFLHDFCHNEVDFGFGFICKKSEKSDKEQNKDGADDHTNNAERRLYFNNVLFNSRNEAEFVLKKMEERIKTVGFVTVADYYLFSLKPAAIESVYYDWGWRDMNGAHLFSWLDNGYLKHTLKLPDALPIEHN